MRYGKSVFIDSGAWIALALVRDPLHSAAREQWDILQGAGARLHTSQFPSSSKPSRSSIAMQTAM